MRIVARAKSRAAGLRWPHRARTPGFHPPPRRNAQHRFSASAATGAHHQPAPRSQQQVRLTGQRHRSTVKPRGRFPRNSDRRSRRGRWGPPPRKVDRHVRRRNALGDEQVRLPCLNLIRVPGAAEGKGRAPRQPPDQQLGLDTIRTGNDDARPGAHSVAGARRMPAGKARNPVRRARARLQR